MTHLVPAHGGSSTRTGETASGAGQPMRLASDEARIVGRAISALRGRWVLPILARLCVSPTHFNQLQRELALPSKTLAAALRGMERDGLVTRTAPDRAGRSGSYSLTPKGAELQPALRAFLEWARAHVDDVEQSRARFDNGVPTGFASGARTTDFGGPLLAGSDDVV